MANLFVSYDLFAPNKNYEAVSSAIKAVSVSWAKVHYSLWYLKSELSAQQVAEFIWKSMDANDSLIVVDTSRNTAYWFNLKSEVSKYLQGNWGRQ